MIIVRLWGLAVLGLVLAVLGVQAGQEGDKPKDKDAPAQMMAGLEDALKKARVDGKYAMLVRQIRVTKDQDKYKDVTDLGFREAMGEYEGHRDLPRGHWVYVAPYWYIWRERSADPKPRRDWGPEQATGMPDTDMAGDIVTAWASQTPDGQDEWLLLEYAEPVVPNAVLIHETYNPGAVVKVSVFKLDGSEVEVWKGQDPTPSDSDKGVSVIPFKAEFKTNRVKIYIDSRNYPGWNEIDAVGLRDAGKKIQWAAAVEASTTYAQQMPVAPARPAVTEERMMRLEKQVGDLNKEVKDLKDSIKELKDLLKKQP